MYAFTMKNAFNLFVEKELAEPTQWTQLHSYLDQRSSIMPGKFQTAGIKQINRFVIDVDSCQDRLYGGFDVDWKCGGDWLPMSSTLANLKRCADIHNMQFVFIFNGTMPDTLREREWEAQQINTRKNIFKLFRDPKCKEYRFWSTPVFFDEMLKFEISHHSLKEHSIESSARASRPKNQQKHQAFVYLTTAEDHQKEILRFCYENDCRGLITSDYGLISLCLLEKFSVKHSANFKKMRVFLGRNLRFCEDFGLFSYEVDLDILISSLKLTLNQFAAFYILAGLSDSVTESYLMRFYENVIDKPNLVLNSQAIAFKILEEIAGLCANIHNFKSFTKLVMVISKDLVDKYFVQHQFVAAIRRAQASVGDETSEFYHLAAHSKRKVHKNSKHGFSNVPMFNYNQQPVDSHKTGHRSGSLPRSNPQSGDQNASRNSSNYAQWLKTLKLNHVECRSHVWVYHLLINSKIYLPVTFEPETCVEMLRADELFKHLRTVGYSILFGSAYPSKDGEFTVTEVMIDTLKDKIHYEKVNFKASTPKTPFQHDSAKARKNRLEFLLNAVSCPPHLRKYVEKKHHHYHKIFLACIMLRYILGYRQFLRAKDIRSFLATFIVNNRFNNFTSIISLVKEHRLKIQYHPRAMHLAHLFVRGMETLHFLDHVCSSNFERSFYLPRLFHGTLFHLCYSLYDTDQEKLIGLSKEEINELDDLYFSITCDLTSNIIIDPAMGPYELKPVTPSALYTPTSLNKSFFGGPKDSPKPVIADKFSPNKLTMEPSMLHIGGGRGILACSAPKKMPRPGRCTINDWIIPEKPIEPKPKPVEEDDGTGFMDYDTIYNFYYDHYTMIYLYQDRKEEAMLKEAAATRPKALRYSATQILAQIGIHQTPEERREQLKRLRHDRMVSYLREKLKPDANNKVKFSQLLPFSIPFHRGISKEDLRGCVIFTYHDDMFPLCEHPQENLLKHGHTRMPEIAFKRPFIPPRAAATQPPNSSTK